MFNRFLLWSVKKEYPLLTRFALWLGANTNVKDKNGDTLLHILIESKNKEKAEAIGNVLAKKGIDIYAKNDKQQTPLEYAVTKKNTTITKWLVTQYKADKAKADKTKDFDHAENLRHTLTKLVLDKGMVKPNEADENIALSLVDGLRSVHGYNTSKLKKLNQDIQNRLPGDSTNPLFELISHELCRKQTLHERNEPNITSSKSLSKTPNKVLDNNLKSIIKDLPLQHSTPYSSKEVEARSPDTTSSKSTTTPASSRSRGSSGTSSPSSLGR